MDQLPELSTILPTSRRFKKYRADKSKRGRSLALARILSELKKQPDYEEFEPILRTAMTQIKEQGADDSRRRERVIKALQEYACEIGEIADETRLTKTQVKEICLQLVDENLVRQDFRTHSRELGDNKVDLFFWRETD